jgi:uncharacterized protein YecA (UPF0149 family)
MSGTMNRNARCHCGSGKKYKNCHGMAENNIAPRRRIPMGYVLAAIAALAIAAMYVSRQMGATAPPGAAPPGKVWSEEHGHWHDAP